MARVRSPNFPVFGLSKAIDRARVIFDKEQQLAANRDVLSRHLGYAGYNGKSSKVLSALSKYGLLEPVKEGKFRLSGRAMRILFPRSDEDKRAAILEAAAAPALFQDIREEWGGGSPSDANLTNFLLHNGFSQSAISTVIAAYRDTLVLVTQAGGSYDSSETGEDDLDDGAEDEMDMDPARDPARERDKDKGASGGQRPPAVAKGEPYALQLVKGGVLGSFDLRNKDDLETFVAGLNALKAFLPDAPANVDDLLA